MTGAEARKVHGIVLDENGQPLAGATVREVPVNKKNSARAIMVDHQGHFTFDIDDTSKQVVVSFVGYKPQTLTVDKNGELRVQMAPSTESLDEVVVTGYQTLSKERATGSFAKIDSEKISGQRLATVTDLLEGHVAGFNKGQLRGVSTLNGVASPLYVIDGFPVEKTKFNGYNAWEESTPDINMEDIESITVLKDAAATSIYGARAANGVIVITTKKGEKGKVTVNGSASITFQPYKTYTGAYIGSEEFIGLEKEWAAQNPNLTGANAAKYAQNLLDNQTYSSEGIRAILRGYTGAMSKSQVDARLNQLAGRGYKWYEDVDKNAMENPLYQQYNMRVSSATSNNNFNASLSYRHNQLSSKYSNNQKFGVNLQNSMKVTSWLTFDVGTFIEYGNGQSQTFSIWSPGYTVNTYSSLFDDNGNPYVNKMEDRLSKSTMSLFSTYSNLYGLDIDPMKEMGLNLIKNIDVTNRTYGRLVFNIMDGLKFNTQFQYETSTYRQNQLKDKESYYVRNFINGYAVPNGSTVKFNIPYGNIYHTEINSDYAYNFRAQLDYHKLFAEKHDVTAMAGAELIERKNTYNGVFYYNYDPETLKYAKIDQNTYGYAMGPFNMLSDTDIALNKEILNRFVSYYANGAYAYDDKYMLNASIRWDRTNLYASGSKYQKNPIWSVGAGWRLDREEFLRDVQWINMLKLRASYGIGGNISKLQAPYLSLWFNTNNNFNTTTCWVKNRPNPSLRWEKTTTLNLGAEFSMFQGRLNGSFEVYNKKGSDLIATVKGNSTEGYGMMTSKLNVGEMTNRGVELTLNGSVYRDRDWDWSLNGTFGYNKNTVDYVGTDAPSTGMLFDYPEAYPRVGNSYNAIYAYEWGGLSKEGTPQLKDAQGNVLTNKTPTQAEDVKCYGTSVPVWNGAFGSNLRYKDWTLSMLFLYEGGHLMRDTSTKFWDSYSSVVNPDIANRWMKPGDEARTDIPRYISSENPLYNGAYGSMYNMSSVRLLDASNVRLRNISIRYNVPASLLKQVHVSNLYLQAGLENVFMIANKDVKFLMGGYNNPNYVFSLNFNF